MKKRTELRKIEIVRNFTKHAAGSVLIKWGDTWVLCTASVEEKVPPFLKDTGRGWVTAEYSMLPSSTGGGRKDRDIKKLKQDARSTEIQRLIGRALRAAVDFSLLGERQITIDCDVLQADGGTRCASITGGMVALELAVAKLMKAGLLKKNPIVHRVAAVSVGVCDGRPTLDLDYAHDSTAEVDLNVIMTDDGRFVELQGCAEHKPFTDAHLTDMLKLAKSGLKRIFAIFRKGNVSRVFFLLVALTAALSVQGAVLREYEAKSGNSDEMLPGKIVGANLFADDSLWQKPNNYCDRLNIVRKDGKVVLTARSKERVDTGFSLVTRRCPLPTRGLGYAIGFGTTESPKQPLSGGSGGYSCAVIWYDHADKEIERDVFQLRVRSNLRERRVMFGSVPLAAHAYAIQFGFDRPDIFGDIAITLDSLGFSILPRETDENWIVKPEPEAPRVRLISRSPSPEPFEELKIEITSQKPVDPKSVVVKVDHKDITAKCTVEKGVWSYKPTEKWTEWIHPIEITLVDPESGDELVSKKVFYRGKDPKTPKVTLRGDGVTLVDGKPFFPIGLFAVCKREFNDNSYDKAMAGVAAAGVNLVQNYSDHRSKEFLDAAEKHGLKVWVQSYDVDKQLFQETRNHPAVLSWYVGDDTSMHDTPFTVYDRTDRVRAVDTTRLVAQADVMNSGDSVSSYRAFVKTTDVFMPEVYPCCQANVVPEPNCVKAAIRDVECFKKDVAEAGDGKPHAVWPIIQYFMGWNAWKRYPTRDELFAMTFASIAHGAQGVTFYTYGGFQIPEKKKFDYGVTHTPEIWGNFTNLTSRLAFLAPALVEPTPLQPRCSDPEVSVLLKRRGCEAYLIVVNNTIEPRQFKVEFGALADWAEGEVLWEGRSVKLSRDSLTDSLAGFGVHVYRFVRPDVTYVAHQGEESLAPSHTKAAYDLAVEHGLERVKLDVQRTKDGVLVTQHDPTLKSTYGWDVRIAGTTYAEMLEHKAKAYHTGYDNETISTFKEGLERGKKMKDGIWIDFKAYDEALVEQTLKECREAGLPDDKIIIATWCWPALVYCHQHYPNIRRVAHTYIKKVADGYMTNNGPKNKVYPTEKDLVNELLRQKAELNLFGFNLPHVVRKHKTLYHTTEYVLRAVKKSGAWISIWFVDDEFTGEQYRAWGADNFVTAWKERTLRGFRDDPERRKRICWEEFNLDW